MIACHVCGGSLHRINVFPALIQIASGHRPWSVDGDVAVCLSCGIVQKPVTDRWRNDAEKIHQHYVVYSQSNGIEQKSFDQKSGGAPRSKKLIEILSSRMSIISEGSLLDVGCGNGSFLRSFAATYPQWKMTGLELTDHYEASVLSISGVESFRVGSVESLNAKYNLITLIHVLEHIPDPINFLRLLSDKLLTDGFLVIEVPNFNTSPFDILIAEHCSHFTRRDLEKIIEKTPFDVVEIVEDNIPKELTVILQLRKHKDPQTGEVKNTAATTDISYNLQTLLRHLDYLHSFLDLGRSVLEPVGIFGTSIAGTWLAESLREMQRQVAFFVDEDESRIGRVHLGKPIIPPSEIPKRSIVIFPLPVAIAVGVAKRLSYLDCKFLIPGV